jgi:Family of unknown function (DUF6370)
MGTLAAPSAVRAEEPLAAAALAKADVRTDAKEVTLKGTLGCAKCSFQQATECMNVLKVKDGTHDTTYVLADNETSRANHEKVCGPASPATVTGTVTDRPKDELAAAKKKGDKTRAKKLLTASKITFDR